MAPSGPWKLYLIMGIVFLIVAALATYAVYLLVTERSRADLVGPHGRHPSLESAGIDPVRKVGPAGPEQEC